MAIRQENQYNTVFLLCGIEIKRVTLRLEKNNYYSNNLLSNGKSKSIWVGKTPKIGNLCG
jgi:hypothetical protein